jgi:thiamine-phosphate pyrophosphorylase
MSTRPLLALARRVAVLVRRYGAVLILNDRVDLAAASGADGVHLGRRDLPPSEARRMLGPEAIVGATTHSFAEARAAAQAGADYLSVGPMFPSTTKPDLPARGFGYVRRMPALGLPFYCIGGIDASNLRRVTAAGGTRVAVCAGVVAQADIRGAAAGLARLLDRADGRAR